MNYKNGGRGKVYSTIINWWFESMIEPNNEELMKDDGIVVSHYGSNIKYKDMFNATVHYFHNHVSMHKIFYLRVKMVACNRKYATFVFTWIKKSWTN